MLTNFLTFLATWKAYITGALLGALVATVVVGGGAFAVAWRIQDANISHIRMEQAQAVTIAVQNARAEEAKADKISFDAGTKAAIQKSKIQTVSKTLAREVPRHVTPEADSHCVVPVGLVRVLNAAAVGTASLPALPDTAGQSDDSPSGLDLSEVVSVVADNYGAYHEVADQLVQLQDWTTEQAATAEP